jgi:hypothetical protein
MPYTGERIRSRHPFELFFIGFTILVSVGGIISRASRPGSIELAVGPVGSYIWYGALLVGALTALAGIILVERAWGLTLEALGLFISGLGTVFYGITAVVLLGQGASYAAGILFGYGLSALWRAGQIRASLVTVARKRTGNRKE